MIRTVLLATINHDHPQAGIEHAFKGIFGSSNVEVFDYCELQRQGIPNPAINRMFLDLALLRKPDLVFMQLQETNIISAQTLLEMKSRMPYVTTVHWTGDMRRTITEYLSSICKATDLTLASSVGQLGAFREAGARRAEYMQIGVDFQEDLMGDPLWEPPFRVPDVVLCGNHYGTTFPGTPEREAVVRELMHEGIDVGVVGSGWPPNWPVAGNCGVKQQHHIWRRAKVALNVNHFNQIERYYSDRQLISMASGIPLVCWKVPALELEFKQFEHCIMADNPDEFVSHVKSLLADPVKAAALGKAGRAEIFRNHTWFSRILNLIPTVEVIQG
jgi:hypothetical protein